MAGGLKPGDPVRMVNGKPREAVPTTLIRHTEGGVVTEVVGHYHDIRKVWLGRDMSACSDYVMSPTGQLMGIEFTSWETGEPVLVFPLTTARIDPGYGY